MTLEHEATLRQEDHSAGAVRVRWLVLAAALVLCVPSAHAGVTIALQPATQSVAPGAEFDLSVVVTESGSAFNGFDAIVGHVPAALTVLSLSPLSLQEGSLMTSACANRFHRFRRGVDRDTLTDVLLCSGVSVTGPGQIYRLRLRASTTPQTTTVHLLPGTAFYNAGISVSPLSMSDATVVIGSTVGLDIPVRSASGLRLHASPNPSRSLTTLRVEADAAGHLELEVCDLLGRVVRHLASSWIDAGRHERIWDGRDDSGARVAPGVYYAQLRAETGVVHSPIVRIE